MAVSFYLESAIFLKKLNQIQSLLKLIFINQIYYVMI